MDYLENESLRERMAYEAYYIMGEIRSIRRVASELEWSVTIIGKWCKENKWVERVRARDRRNMERVAKKNDNTIVEKIVERQKKLASAIGIAEKVLFDSVEKVKKGKISIKTPEQLNMFLGRYRDLMETDVDWSKLLGELNGYLKPTNGGSATYIANKQYFGNSNGSPDAEKEKDVVKKSIKELMPDMEVGSANIIDGEGDDR